MGEPYIFICDDRVITSDDFDPAPHRTWGITFEEPQDIRDILMVLCQAGLSTVKFVQLDKPEKKKKENDRGRN